MHRLWSLLFVFVLASGCLPDRSDDDRSQTRPPGDSSTARQSDDEPASNAAVTQPPVTARPNSFADAVEESRPAIVNIYTRTRVQTNRYFVTPNRKLIPEERLSQSLGSGFIIDDDGHVLTNFHVIKNATDIEVRLFDGRLFEAKLVGDDPKTDIALLQIQEAEDLPVARLGDSDELRVGDWVVAIGNPLGLTSTVTAGIVSANGRKSLPLGELRYQDFIQTDASINPGNSGGALLDAQGRVVGVNTAITQQGQGIGFAIPINMVRDLLPRLQQGGRIQRSWLGLYIDPVPEPMRAEIGLPESGGALVTRIVPGGPAARAKLRPGDVILKIGGDDVEDADQLAWLAGNVGVGKEVELRVQRGNETLDVTVVMGALPD